ncbi:methyl-accepting chemotaxis protein [Curvibacter sp. RS43]|uniref:methyl-accepting chemotaxis protein n=1 Tax=Curvibacter microcysteis TaxID=3026419 RepID=UPI00235DEFF1|nr:methyl-accepting chemotaxis protein [Curvibacter sp. RS43]MDD0811259.1 methyl-accepting chemotaxis protein [Curvibacter sp. RS43]
MQKLSIGTRLALGFGLLLSLTLLNTGLGNWQLQTATEATQAIIDQPLSKERLISDWYRLIHSAVRRTTAIAKSSDPSLATFFATEQKESAAATTAIQKQVEGLMISHAEKQLFAEISDLRKTYVAARDEVIRLKRDGQAADADKLLESTFLPTATRYVDRVKALLEMQRSALDQAATPIREANDRARHAMWLLGALCLAAGVTCSVLITRSITAPLSRSLRVAQQVASGDLSPLPAHLSDANQTPDTRDESRHLLLALGTMQGSLTQVIQGIRQAADNIATASAEIANGNHDLSVRTEQTATNLQSTASSIEQLTGHVQHTAEAARSASELASHATEVASHGGAVVSQVVNTMEAINASSRRIADITGLIDSIAFQTNILALNAAVEAARAGEQGRGFAVVASEVRTLAQRSAEAAREIKGLITSSVERVEDGTRQVHEAGRTMEDIVGAVQRVTTVVSDIANASGEQSQGIALVNQAIGQLDQMTQQNAALVEESAAAAQSLREQAERLTQTVASFTLGQSPSGARTRPNPALLGT